MLYYVRANETCTMSLAAAYFENKSTSHGVTIETTEVIIFPSGCIMEWQLKLSILGQVCNAHVQKPIRSIKWLIGKSGI